MEELTLAGTIAELRESLTTALGLLSRMSPKLPAVEDASKDCRSLYFSIEEILALAHDAERMRGQFPGAHKQLQACLTSANQALLELENCPAQRGKYYVQRLHKIVGAINTAALLVAIRLKQTRRSKLRPRIWLLTDFCKQHTSHSTCTTTLPQRPQLASKTSIPQSMEGYIQELLQPDCLSYLKHEANICWRHHVELTYDKAPSNSSIHLLDVNIINWVFRNRPACTRGTRPILVSHHSDVMQAARVGDVAKLSQILDTNLDMRYCFTLMGLTPMFFAIEGGHLDAVECLMRYGVKVGDYCGRTKTTPLAAALEFRHLHLVEFFLEKGASLKDRNRNGWTVLFYLWYKERRCGQVTQFLQLLKKHKDWHHLHQNVFDKEGYAVIHRAAKYGSPPDLLTLIRFGVNPRQRTRRSKANRHGGDYASWSALQLVIHHGYLDSFETLFPIYLREERDSEMPNEHGYTLLHLAVSQGHMHIATRLIEQGANIDARTPVPHSDDLDANACGCTVHELAEDAGVYEQFCEIVKTHREAKQSTATSKGNSSCDEVLELHIQREGNEPQAENKNRWSVELRIPEVDRLGSCRHSNIDSACDDESEKWALSKTYTYTAVSGHGSSHQGDVININRHSTINLYFSVREGPNEHVWVDMNQRDTLGQQTAPLYSPI